MPRCRLSASEEHLRPLHRYGVFTVTSLLHVHVARILESLVKFVAVICDPFIETNCYILFIYFKREPFINS